MHSFIHTLTRTSRVAWLLCLYHEKCLNKKFQYFLQRNKTIPQILNYFTTSCCTSELYFLTNFYVNKIQRKILRHKKMNESVSIITVVLHFKDWYKFKTKGETFNLKSKGVCFSCSLHLLTFYFLFLIFNVLTYGNM